MASREYCTNVSLELEGWSDKLHKLTSDIDRLSTGEKYRLFPQIEELHIILAELDDRLCGLMHSCSVSDEEGGTVEEGVFVAPKFNINSNERFDYEFGG